MAELVFVVACGLVVRVVHSVSFLVIFQAGAQTSHGPLRHTHTLVPVRTDEASVAVNVF